VRLLHWPARRPEPVGRHSRVLTGVSMPGAAASLVASTVTAESVVAEAQQVAREQSASADESLSVTDAANSSVTLGFADGASVALGDDDPRVRTFRAAAAALLDAPAR
jgi:hypothetical protein